MTPLVSMPETIMMAECRAFPTHGSDKEAVRPMYREFKNLEAKIAAFTAAGETAHGGSVAAPGAVSGSVEDSLSAASSTKSSQIKGAKETGDIEEQGAIRAAREDKKREIKEWIKAFEDREGHPPSSECVQEDAKTMVVCSGKSAHGYRSKRLPLSVERGHLHKLF